MLMPMLNACRCGHGIIEVPRVHTDSVARIVYRTDTIYVADSVHTERVADTVYTTRVRNVYRSRCVTDTLHRVATDTVTIVAEPPRGERRERHVPAWMWAIAASCVAVWWLKKR